MRFHQLDLNLLIALDAMLREQNVTRAAERLNLSQSAMSSALSRLRAFFKDDLFVPVGRQMGLTPLAAALQDHVRHLLLQAQVLIDTKPVFDPAQMERRVRMIASDFVIEVLLIDVIHYLQSHAPGIRIDIEPPGRKGERQLAHGEIDLMITPEFVLDPEQPWRPLFEDAYVCCAWEGNTTIGRPPTLNQYLETGHVQVCFGHDRTKTFDTMYMERMGWKRNDVIVAPSFSIVPYIVEGTELITTLPAKLAVRYAERARMVTYPLPLEIPPLVQVLQWNKLYDRDPLLMWLRAVILDHARGKWPSDKLYAATPASDAAFDRSS
jgi:DNA-binding transcriptional LysR family regulator